MHFSKQAASEKGASINSCGGDLHAKPTCRSATQTMRHAEPLRIALVDKNKDIYADLKKISEDENWSVIFFSDASQALKDIPVTPPDVVLIVMQFPEPLEVDCTQKLRCLMPNLPVMMLADRSSFEDVFAAFTAGAAGYLIKPWLPDAFRVAISNVVNGNLAYCEAAQTNLLFGLRNAFTNAAISIFTERERQVLACLLENMPDKDIAKRLNIETNTVHVYMVRIFQRLGTHNRKQAVHRLFQRCLGIRCHDCAGPRNFA